jgi:hypothetical protein
MSGGRIPLPMHPAFPDRAGWWKKSGELCLTQRRKGRKVSEVKKRKQFLKKNTLAPLAPLRET